MLWVVWGSFWVDNCLFFSKPHLKTGNSKTAGIVRRRGHWHHEGAVGDVLVVEADGNLIVSCNEHRSIKLFYVLRRLLASLTAY